MAAGCQPHRIFQRGWRRATTPPQSRARVSGSSRVGCCQVMSGSDHFLKRLGVIHALSRPRCFPGPEIPTADWQQLSPSPRFFRGNCRFQVLSWIEADASRLRPSARPTKTCQGWSGSAHFFDMFSGWNGSPIGLNRRIAGRPVVLALVQAQGRRAMRCLQQGRVDSRRAGISDVGESESKETRNRCQKRFTRGRPEGPSPRRPIPAEFAALSLRIRWVVRGIHSL